MSEDSATRRTVLTGIGTAVFTGVTGSSAGKNSDKPTRADSRVNRALQENGSGGQESFTIMEGTEYETTGYVLEGNEAGKTIMVVGGIHGNETAGYRAAEAVAQESLDVGTLVVLPRANVPAIAADARAVDGVDLNRQFPTDEAPETALARAIWGVVEQYDPEALVDLHESDDLYDPASGDVSPEDGVGQAIFHSGDERATTVAKRTAARVNEDSVPESNPDYDFEVGPFSAPDVDPMGLLVHKFARDTDGSAFLVETLSSGPSLEQRVAWHRAVVDQLIVDFQLC